MEEKDLKQLAELGITEEQVEKQLKQFETGFPYLKLEAPASVEKGIKVIPEALRDGYIKVWDKYRYDNNKHRVTKFVPASGAASRMFKDLFAFLDADYDVPTTDFEKTFFENIKKYGFYDRLQWHFRRYYDQDMNDAIAEGQYKKVVSFLLKPEGLNYGQMPKGLIDFHEYPDIIKTPVDEHMTEAAIVVSFYKYDNRCLNPAYLHFTVSPEHLPLFKERVEKVRPYYEQRYQSDPKISYSIQKPSTSTIAVNPDNTLFRNEDGSLLFRPGGHGALIENLNDIDANVVFIKNIDNVQIGHKSRTTLEWKMILGGVLVTIQKAVFYYMEKLDKGDYTRKDLQDMIHFVQDELCTRKLDIKDLEDAELVIYLKKKLNRPIRVCGVVKNVGEPGGGPFLAYNADGTISPQILESSQIDKNNEEYMKMFKEGTHFNPVDLVCGIKDYKGNKFNLLDFVDPNTGFISSKSKNGKELRALELPGLWNGAMSDWSTVFVEVPIETFSPVKTVNDLLRDAHQGEIEFDKRRRGIK